MPYTAKAGRYTTGANWFRRCGRSGLQLPAVSLGCWHNFGEAGSDAGLHRDEAAQHENCRQMLFTAFDLGITHFDLANTYGPPFGAAESRVGRILREDLAAYRDELIISTKAGWTMWPGPYGDWGSRKHVLASLDQSLRRLGLEYVDIFYSHRFDPHTPLEETLFALDTAVRSGKALYAGISAYDGLHTTEVVRICQSHGWVQPIIHQPNYSLLRRNPERDVFPACEQHGMGTIAYCPLAQGLLTSKYLGAVPADSRVRQEKGALREEQLQPAVLEKVRTLHALAQERGQSLAQMSLAWALRGNLTSALIGASRPSQITENAACLSRGAFSPEELQRIDAILDGRKA